MEPKNRWLIMGGIAVVGAFVFIFLRGKSATANASAPAPIIVNTPADLSTVGNIPETGFNAGNFPATGSGFNGLGAGGVPLTGSNTFPPSPGGPTECNCPNVPAGATTTPGPPPCNCPTPTGATGGAGGMTAADWAALQAAVAAGGGPYLAALAGQGNAPTTTNLPFQQGGTPGVNSGHPLRQMV